MNMEELPRWIPSLFAPFFTLSYPTNPPAEPDSFSESKYYRIGLYDIFFMVTCISVMAVLRDGIRIYIMEPFAKWYLTRKYATKPSENGATVKNPLNGSTQSSKEGKICDSNFNTSKKHERKITRSVLRFAEQGWSFIYYTMQFTYGFYIHHNLPTYPFKPTQVWINYPHIPLSAPVKFYYLTQTSFYLHQILVLHAEARRKDHYQMLTHHVITVVLMVTSYYYGLNRVGCIIMVLMDWCDIFFPLAKMFRYLELSTLCDIAFTWFLLSWFFTRHVGFIIITISAIWDAPKFMTFAWEPEKEYYYSYQMHMTCVGLLIILQVIQLLWFSEICKVAWRVITGKGAEDTRSDDEDELEVSNGTSVSSKSSQSELKKRRPLTPSQMG